MDIRNRIRDLGGYTQVAAKVGLTENHLRSVLRGDHMPRVDTAIRIAEVLGIEIEDLFCRDRDRDPEAA